MVIRQHSNRVTPFKMTIQSLWKSNTMCNCYTPTNLNSIMSRVTRIKRRTNHYHTRMAEHWLWWTCILHASTSKQHGPILTPTAYRGILASLPRHLCGHTEGATHSPQCGHSADPLWVPNQQIPRHCHTSTDIHWQTLCYALKRFKSAECQTLSKFIH